ncbi:jg10074 [Pararge aegeria aegeria]|uniref:Jg10074 protein n=1 Tax=Pararge aegeria aegeria TaxID=348720 RepID=A0A8S4SC82_9NEOP|nr:jg10074 [Pararge aegeria aegeria]
MDLANDHLNEMFRREYIKRLGNLVDQHVFILKKGKNAVQARKKLTDVYGEGVLTVRQCQNWFAKFRSGNFDVEDAPRSGRPVEADKDAIKALVDANRRITTREIGWENGIVTVPGVSTSILLILARANKPVRLSAGGMYDLSLEAYATVR